MQFFIPQTNTDESKSSKKCDVNNGALAVIGISCATLFSSTGLLFNIFDDDDESADNGINVPRVTHFIEDKTREQVVDLEGEWSFAVGDGMDRARKDFDDSSWFKVEVPSDWESDGYDGYDGFAWYRRPFSIDESDTYGSLYLYMGRIDDVDEVFINGRRIGGQGVFPPEVFSAYDRDRIYKVPDGLVQAGSDNIISVRVYDGQQAGGIVSGKIGLFAATVIAPLVDLSGDWKIRLGDDLDWANESIDESKFDRIQVPLAWDALGYDRYDGFAWYRKSFGELSVSPDETLVLILGKIDDADETYLNGQLIGQTGGLGGSADNTKSYSQDREYEFPASLLKESNTIAVRVYDGQQYGGIYSGPVGIMTKADFAMFKEELEEARDYRWSATWDWLLGRD